ncbi:MAG: polyprenyl synthetase family protein [Candidatus Marinimicrobia bacterium]|nr:polyprenyl synthetase family protein [Candidatus Neomarinimicrobiota bacterium]
MPNQITLLIKKYQDIINRGLEEIPIPGFPNSLYEPLVYSLHTQGKRIRPILTLMVGEGFGVPIEKLLPAALALETLHTYTLVHDDIMDNDDLRRGRPTVHKKWDVNTAILSGDAINTLAFRLLMDTDSPNLQRMGKLFTEGMLEICEGQALDMEFEHRIDVTVEEYMTMVTKKTAVLLALSCKIGGLIADCDENTLMALENFAIKTGQAFQIQDDLLEILSDEEAMGKSLGSDFAAGKKTYPMLLALSGMNKKEQKEFLTFLKNNSNIIKIRERFLKSGSIDKAGRTVNELITESKENLKGCPSQVRDSLLALLEFLQKRKS